MDTYTIELLGSPVVRRQSTPVTFVRRKTLAVIVYLACTRRWISREELAELLWPERPQGRALGSLRTVLTELRTTFQGELILTENSMIALDWTVVECDLHQLRTILLQEPELIEMRRAADLWKGGFLKGFHVRGAIGFTEWLRYEEQNVFCEFKHLLRSLYSLEIKMGELSSALTHARACLGLDVFDEESHRSVMLIHALSGERKFAVQHYTRCCELIQQEFNTTVDDETRQLFERITHGDIGRQQEKPVLHDRPYRLAILPFRPIRVSDPESMYILELAMEALEDFFVDDPRFITVSRTSTRVFANAGMTISAIAEEMQVDYIIEGYSILTGDGPMILEGRLIRAKSDSVVTLKQVRVNPSEEDCLLAVNRIGAAFLSHLNLIGEDVQQAARDDIPGYGTRLTAQLKLRAKHLLRIDDGEKALQAIELYRKAVQLDDNDAEAWSGIGYAYLTLHEKGLCWPNRIEELTEVERVARKALSINADEPSALHILGNIAIQKGWKCIEAEAFYLKSLRVFPNNPRALRDYAELCIMTGRFNDAKRLTDQVITLDPVHHHTLKLSFWLNLAMREYEKADQVLRQQFVLFSAPALEIILQGYIQLIQGNVSSAIMTLEAVRDTPMDLGWENSLLAALGYAYGKTGSAEESQRVIERLLDNLSGRISPHLPLALVHIGSDDLDTALMWIEKAIATHDPALFFLSVNPLFSPLNSHPKSIELLLPTHITLIKNPL